MSLGSVNKWPLLISRQIIVAIFNLPILEAIQYSLKK